MNLDPLETFITEKMSATRLPGLSIALVRGDDVVYAKGFGVADIERKAPAAPETIYGAASITKSFVAIAILQRHGWKEANHSFGLMNPRALVHPESGISMDVSGFVIDKDSGKALTAGAWMPGLPKDWNMIFEFDRIELEKRATPDGSGKAWCMKDPEVWLETIYGNWRVPDKTFDTMVAARNIRQFSLLARCYAYSRIFDHWFKNNTGKALALARHTLARDPSDVLMQKVVSRLNH